MVDANTPEEGKINTTAIVIIAVIIVLIIGGVITYFVIHNKHKKIADASESLNSALKSSTSE